jgi:hypothetical protein
MLPIAFLLSNSPKPLEDTAQTVVPQRQGREVDIQGETRAANRA